METEPKRKRRWFQFRLRTLMIVVTVFAIVGGWIGRDVRIVMKRLNLRRAITSDGGSISLGSESSILGHVWERSEVTWFRRLLGDDDVLGVQVPDGDRFDWEVEQSRELFPEVCRIHRTSDP
jgi:hypothetical protein